MHLVIHSEYYPPEVGAPQTRLHELAVRLLQKGIDVTVLTSMPNYPQGCIYPGYKKWFQNERLDGVNVVRTAILPTQSAGMLRRLVCYLSFAFSSLLIGGFRISQADYLLTESPPLFLGLAGFLLSRWKQARWIFNISDLWPESVVELGIIRRKSISYKISSLLEEFLYEKAWVVTAQSRTILEHILERLPHLRCYHLPNGVDTEFFQSIGIEAQADEFNVVYAGLHGLAQGLEQIITAAHQLSPALNVHLRFIGDGPEKERLMHLAKELNLSRIRFDDPVPKDKIPSILAKADLLVVPLKQQLTGAVPSKIYEAMAVGKPVLLVGSGEAAEIVEEAKCGVVVKPGDIDGIVKAITYLKNHPEKRKQMGINGRESAVKKHDRKLIADNFVRFITEEAFVTK